MPTPIGTIGAVESLTVAGRVFTDLDNLMNFTGSPPAVNVYAGMTLDDGSNTGLAYQVTTGKTLTISAFVMNSQAASSNITSIGYSTSAASVVGQSSAPSGDTYCLSQITQPTAIGAYGERAVNFKCPSDKFLFCLVAAGQAVVSAWGYEA